MDSPKFGKGEVPCPCLQLLCTKHEGICVNTDLPLHRGVQGVKAFFTRNSVVFLYSDFRWKLTHELRFTRWHKDTYICGKDKQTHCRCAVTNSLVTRGGTERECWRYAGLGRSLHDVKLISNFFWAESKGRMHTGEGNILRPVDSSRRAVRSTRFDDWIRIPVSSSICQNVKKWMRNQCTQQKKHSTSLQRKKWYENSTKELLCKIHTALQCLIRLHGLQTTLKWLHPGRIYSAEF